MEVLEDLDVKADGGGNPGSCYGRGWECTRREEGSTEKVKG
jgi:hypothetical protein